MILTLEQQVCSLESAKRLKELGFPQESLFYWGVSRHFDGSESGPFIFVRSSNEIELNPWRLVYDGHYSFCRNDFNELYSAYTVAELGELLPYRLRMEDDDYWLTIFNIKQRAWEIRYRPADNRKITPLNFIKQADTEAEARAKMLIYLKENKLI